MREIKFRGKRLDNGEWVYGSLVLFDGAALIADLSSPNNCTGKPVNPKTVGQYPGLKDKHNKEIYEGDIVFVTRNQIFTPGNFYSERNIRLVEFNNDEVRFGWSISGLMFCKTAQTRLEIIGNKHDNPELLEEK